MLRADARIKISLPQHAFAPKLNAADAKFVRDHVKFIRKFHIC